MFRRVLLAIAVMAGSFSPMSASADEPVVREVLAGAKAPGGASGPFVHTAYYPETVRAHQGDLVRWTFPGSYGWHSVSFGSVPRVARNDEHPGHLAFDEEWLFGPELGNESKQCGRGNWWHIPDQSPCVLSDASIERNVSSSIWDRFFGIQQPASTFTAEVQLEPGTYPYFCKLHPWMTGTLLVEPEGVDVVNPSREEIDQQILADQREAEQLRAELSDPADAWDPVAEEWVVRVGAQTANHRVDIHEFLPTTLPIAPGDRVRFVGGTNDPSSVAFPSDAQGGFYTLGSCDADGCEPGPVDSRGVPWGMTGLAFPWSCDPDDRESGLPGVIASYLAPRMVERAQAVDMKHGCQVGSPELLWSPYISRPTRAPGDAVVPGAVHISGMLMPEETPDWYAGLPDGSRIPHEFEASFPVDGTFTYACLNHEFMKGSIQVG